MDLESMLNRISIIFKVACYNQQIILSIYFKSITVRSVQDILEIRGHPYSMFVSWSMDKSLLQNQGHQVHLPF